MTWQPTWTAYCASNMSLVCLHNQGDQYGDCFLYDDSSNITATKLTKAGIKGDLTSSQQGIIGNSVSEQ